jgi:hypothetical protein
LVPRGGAQVVGLTGCAMAPTEVLTKGPENCRVGLVAPEWRRRICTDGPAAGKLGRPLHNHHQGQEQLEAMANVNFQ